MKIKNTIIYIFTFIVLYSFFIINFNFTVENYSDIIVATTFFFALFIGFFIARQNDRYSSVSDLIATSDGHFSYLYRVTAMVPRIQKEVREIIREHYKKIMDSKNWVYHIVNPSNTITKMTATLTSLTKKENDNPVVESSWGFMFEQVSDLQNFRKSAVGILNQKLTMMHWIIVYILGILVVVSFSLVPTTSLFVEILQILFATSVFLSIVLLHQLDGLTIFGDNAAESTAKDIFRIIDEEDKKELSKKKSSKINKRQ